MYISKSAKLSLWSLDSTTNLHRPASPRRPTTARSTFGVTHSMTPGSCAGEHGTLTCSPKSARVKLIDDLAPVPPPRDTRTKVPPHVGPLLGTAKAVLCVSRQCGEMNPTGSPKSTPLLLICRDTDSTSGPIPPISHTTTFVFTYRAGTSVPAPMRHTVRAVCTKCLPTAVTVMPFAAIILEIVGSGS